MDDDDQTPVDSAPGIAARATASAASTAFGLVVGGPIGAVAGALASPMLEVPFQRAINEVTGVKRDAAKLALHSASERLDLEPDHVVEKALTAVETTQLLADTLTAAANTVNQRKIAALAQALARGLREDDARVDEEVLVVAALAAVEAPHVRVLTQLGPERSRSRVTSSNLRGRTAPRRGQSTTTIAAASGLSAPGARAVLAVLERVGMARADEAGEVMRLEKLIFELQQEVNKLIGLTLKPPKGSIPINKKPKVISRPGSPAATAWSLTPFGQVCLDYLDDIDPDPSWGEARDPGLDADADADEA
jgi:hypothetical protein